jgi:non-ribosomal peptide synthetase component F
MMQFASIAFDVSIFEMLLTWSVGATLCAADKDTLLFDLELAIRSLKVTHIDLTPSVASIVRREKIPCLQYLISGGEAISASILKEWGNGKGLINAYGPSEVCNFRLFILSDVPAKLISTITGNYRMQYACWYEKLR